MWIAMKQHFEARSLEWFSAGILFAWGTQVSLHPGMFLDPSKGTVFNGLLAMWDQATWAYVTTMVASIRLVALFINGKWGLTPWIRTATSFLSVGAWFCVTVGLLNGTANTGVVVYGGLMLADMFSAFRAAGDAAEARVNKRVAEKLTAHGIENADNVSFLAPSSK